MTDIKAAVFLSEDDLIKLSQYDRDAAFLEGEKILSSNFAKAQGDCRSAVIGCRYKPNMLKASSDWPAASVLITMRSRDGMSINLLGLIEVWFTERTTY